MLTPDLNVITVVDPGEDTTIELRPCEILQVVITGINEITWRVEKQKSVYWKALRYETCYNDGFERHRENFAIIDQTEFGVLQHHFWFRISPRDYKDVVETRCGCTETTTFGFYEKEKFKGKLTIFLVMESEDKDDFQKLAKCPDNILKEARLLGINNRFIDEEHGYILNPGSDEQIMFETRQRIMMVEIAEPPNKRRWNACLTTAMNSAEFSITEMNSRHINGVRIQRFQIKNHIVQLPYNNLKMRLGDVIFRVNHEPKWNKKINFLVCWERHVDNYIFDDEDEDPYRWIQCATRRVHKPQKFPVKIEEIDVAGDIKAGARVINVFVQKKRILEIADPADNSIIHVPHGEELTIMLYKDHNVYPPCYEMGQWTLDHDGTCVMANRMTHDIHHQRFFFKTKENPTNGETLTFKMRDRVKKIHITCSGLKVIQEVKKVTQNEIDNILNELLNNDCHWRTVTSLSKETGIEQVKIVEALDNQLKEGRVIQHPDQAELWGHKDKVRVGIKRSVRKSDL